MEWRKLIVLGVPTWRSTGYEIHQRTYDGSTLANMPFELRHALGVSGHLTLKAAKSRAESVAASRETGTPLIFS